MQNAALSPNRFCSHYDGRCGKKKIRKFWWKRRSENHENFTFVVTEFLEDSQNFPRRSWEISVKLMIQGLSSRNKSSRLQRNVHMFVGVHRWVISSPRWRHHIRPSWCNGNIARFHRAAPGSTPGDGIFLYFCLIPVRRLKLRRNWWKFGGSCQKRGENYKKIWTITISAVKVSFWQMMTSYDRSKKNPLLIWMSNRCGIILHSLGLILHS